MIKKRKDPNGSDPQVTSLPPKPIIIVSVALDINSQSFSVASTSIPKEMATVVARVLMSVSQQLLSAQPEPEKGDEKS